jgi:hypothetical protein
MTGTVTLEDELKEDGWPEAGFRRDTWWANILHLTTDAADRWDEARSDEV